MRFLKTFNHCKLTNKTNLEKIYSLIKKNTHVLQCSVTSWKSRKSHERWLGLVNLKIIMIDTLLIYVCLLQIKNIAKILLFKAL